MLCKEERTMLKRKLYDDLLVWKNERSKDKALFLMGARQVGKSTLAREFGKKNFEQVIEVNFLETPLAQKFFKNADPAQILTSLTAWSKKTIIPGQTLIILDEIQECPHARTAIKFLVQEGSCCYIETGSLLGIQNKPVQSYPVGFEEQMNMYPLDFEEFLWAMDFPEESIRQIQKNYRQKSPVLEGIHELLLRYFNTYIVVGGMPEVVSEYVKTKDITRVKTRQKAILDLYRNDISKFVSGLMSLKVRQIFDSIPAQLDDKSRRFRMNAIGKGRQFRDLEDSFLWLEEAGIALPCYNTAAPVTPLRMNEKRNLFKLFMNDTGLLCAASLGEDIPIQLLMGNLQINSGSILENAFAQALKSKGLDLYYFDSKKIGELDFVVQNGSTVDVLEIKSGADYTKHAALDRALQVQDWPFRQKIVFCKSNVFEEDGILYLPYYMILFYAQKEEKKLIWDPLQPNFN